MNTDDILTASEGLLKRIERISYFSRRYGVDPHQEIESAVNELQALAAFIPDFQTPRNQDELIQSELRRRLIGESDGLYRVLISGERYDFDDVVSFFAIPKQDIEGLRQWLEVNRDETRETINRLWDDTGNTPREEFPICTDIPRVQKEVEEFAETHVERYHDVLGGLFKKLTDIGEFLKAIKAVPTYELRSYFSPLTKTLALSIPSICYIGEDGGFHIQEQNLIELYGHEGMGHALNEMVTLSSGLPYFLAKKSALTSATMESVAQFYQKIILEDLKADPETQRALGIEQNFDEIYYEATGTRLLREYQSKLSYYAITVIADKSLGDPNDPKTIDKKVGLIRPFALDSTSPISLVEGLRYKGFDSRGNLNSQIVSELVYCAQPVQRALEEFAKRGITYEGEGRSVIDMTLLKGFWTPIGFVDNARLRAEQYKTT